ncbi:hypothetical protein ACHAWX_004404 [Stephanocyclus meneghinianus]
MKAKPGITPPSSTISNRSPFKASKPNDDNRDPIAVIIGKTFESTTLPDGSQQIIEITKYKRLNDGHVYTESKLRNPMTDDDKENASQNATPGISPGGLYGGQSSSKNTPSNCGFKLNLSNQLACPSSLTLTSSSGSVSSENSRPGIIGNCGGSYDSETSNSQKGIINCMTKETAQMSVVTEDYEDDSMVEEYLYDNEERRSLSPYAVARKENFLEGWCPSFDDVDNKSLRLQHQSSVWSTWANDSVFGDNVLIQMFDRSNKNAHRNARNKNDQEEDDEDRFHLKASMAMTCKERMNTRKCKLLSCFMVFVVIAIAVVAIAFRPLSESGWQVNKEAHTEPSCIHLEIVIDTDNKTIGKDNPDGDVAKWSLVRHGKKDALINIAKSSELSADTVHNFQHCVQPGVFTFKISDSGGDGLGTDGEGGYYIVADGVRLGVTSFFFHEDEMTFTLPFYGDEYDGDGDTECADDFFLVVKTDANPGQTTWDVVDNDTGKTVLDGGPYELPWAVYTNRACLEDGSYTFNIRDGGKDGVCCDEGYGFYMLYNDGELILNSDGNYGSGQSTVFVLGNHTESISGGASH